MGEATHEELWKCCQKLPGDYSPYGDVDRETARDGDWAPDCSCGCKFYHQLKGLRGMDWGICFNPRSHRYGLLTFEHQGCAHYVAAPGEDLDIDVK